MGFLFPKQPTPEAPKPVRMPVSNDAQVKAAAARERRNIGERAGRTSTIMTRTPPAGGFGTASYGNSLLGQAT